MVVIRKHKPSKTARKRNLNIRRRAVARLNTLTTVPSVVELRSPTYVEAATSPVPEEENRLLEGINILENEITQLTKERSELMDERVGNREMIMQLRVELAEQKEETRTVRQKYNREHNALARERKETKRLKEEREDALMDLDIVNNEVKRKDEEIRSLKEEIVRLEEDVGRWIKYRTGN